MFNNRQCELISKEKYAHFINLDSRARWNKIFPIASKITRCGEDTEGEAAESGNGQLPKEQVLEPVAQGASAAPLVATPVQEPSPQVAAAVEVGISSGGELPSRMGPTGKFYSPLVRNIASAETQRTARSGWPGDGGTLSGSNR